MPALDPKLPSEIKYVGDEFDKVKPGVAIRSAHVGMAASNTFLFLTDVLPRAIKKYGGIDSEALRKAALDTDIPEGGPMLGFGVKFEGEGQPMAVSAGGGNHPFWRGDGEELFYLGPADEVMAVSLTRAGTAIVPSKPKQLFRIPLRDVVREIFAPYGVTPDGQRFLLIVLDRPDPLLLLQGLASVVK